ncbi:peptidase C14 caspase catalytic subunit p20 [Actinoplanes friuliensis DSM 7358]|uniref:Peptidase C14 caspase catalytic subunit p20 n=1 Tax=Actinoplanes friuliensis DSM 7358 TaxID=1246995 RepID=U5W5G4_9ACTN|nr:peptidase C14 caspase catalytic subunit p20 [Actinoplanes friuliensis DSM 7358]
MGGAVAAMAELSGTDDPRPITVVLWLTVAVLAFALPVTVLLTRSRQDRRRHGAEAVGELRRHFLTRGRGVTPSSFRRQWYFTGRERALRELSAWLAGELPGDHRTRVVTGGPGAGKSAVLGRVVTFGFPALRREVPAGQTPADAGLVPPPGSVHCVVHARGRTADQVAADIGRNVGRPVGTALELLAVPHRDAGRPVRGIVIDGVDEAQDPEHLITELLEPLAAGAAAWRIRLLLGLRTGADRSLLRRFGPYLLEVPLDDPGYFDRADLSEYARRCLLAEGEPGVSSPYRKRPELAARVAAAVAQRAGTNFLIVQLTCVTLAALPEATDASPEQFPDSVGAAMERYLAAFGAERRTARDLLVPLAFAQGAGLSDPVVWAALATALGTARYTEQDVAWLLGERRAVHLLTRADDASRLFHEALGEHLRAAVAERTGVRAAHRLITRTLIDHVPPGPDWLAAGKYVRLHLAAHASAAGQVTELLLDPLFLIATDPDEVIGVLPINERAEGRPSPELQDVIDVVLRAGRTLFVRNDAERAAYLQMAARKLGAEELAGRLAALPLALPWSVPWARWRTITAGAGLIGSQNEYVRRLSVGAQLIVACSDNSLGVWRLTAEGIHPVLLPERLRGLLSAAPVPGAVITVHTDGSLLRHDVVSGEVQPWTPKVGVDQLDYCAPITFQGRDLLVLGGASHVRLWDPVDDKPAGPLMQLPPGSSLLDAATCTGRPLVLTDLAGRVRAFDLAAGDPYGESFLAFDDTIADLDGPVWSGALGEADGHVVAVVAGRGDRPIVRYDLDTGGRLGGDLASPGIATMSLAVGYGLLGAGGADGRLKLWSWPAGEPIGHDVAAHEGGIDSVAVLELNRETVVVTGGRDGATRVWWPRDSAARTKDDLSTGQLLRMRVGGKERLLATTGDDLLLLDPGDGRTIATRPAPNRGRDTLGRYLGPGPGNVAITMADGTVHLIDAATLKTRRRFTAAGPDDIAALATAPGRVLVVTRTGMLQIWDPARPRPIRTVEVGPGVWNMVAINGIALAPGRDTIAAVVLDTGQPSAERLAAGCPLSSSIYRIVTGKITGRGVAVGIGASSHVHVWDATKGTLLVDTIIDDGHRMALSDAVVAPLHGRDVVVTGGYAGAIAIWDLDGRVGEVIELGSPVWSLAVVGGDTIVAGGPSGLIAITLGRDAVLTDRARRDLGVRLLGS